MGFPPNRGPKRPRDCAKLLTMASTTKTTPAMHKPGRYLARRQSRPRRPRRCIRSYHTCDKSHTPPRRISTLGSLDNEVSVNVYQVLVTRVRIQQRVYGKISTCFQIHHYRSVCPPHEVCLGEDRIKKSSPGGLDVKTAGVGTATAAAAGPTRTSTAHVESYNGYPTSTLSVSRIAPHPPCSRVLRNETSN